MSALDDKIIRFKNDVEIAHQIIHGDEVTSVTTEGGPVDTFAKVIAENRRKMDAVLADITTVVKKYRFTNALQLRIKHDLDTTDFVETIRSDLGARVYASVKILDENEFIIEFTSPETGALTVVFSVLTEAVSA